MGRERRLVVALDGEPGGHRGDLLEVSSQRVGDGLGEEGRQVEQAEHGSDGYGGVADGGGDAEAEQGDEDEIEDAAGRGAQRRTVADRDERRTRGRG